MTLYDLELGFDIHMVNIQGSERFQPLQYGLRVAGGRDPRRGGWLTSLVEGDEIEITISDITLLSDSASEGAAPSSLALDFQSVVEGKAAPEPPIDPAQPVGGTFGDGILRFGSDQIVSIGERSSWVFGGGRLALPAWQVVYPVGSSTPLRLRVLESIYKLSLELTVDSGQQFAVDPEWVVDPYGGG